MIEGTGPVNCQESEWKDDMEAGKWKKMEGNQVHSQERQQKATVLKHI